MFGVVNRLPPAKSFEEVRLREVSRGTNSPEDRSNVGGLHVHVLALVSFVRHFLAAGFARTGALPIRVADSSAVSDCRNRSGRRPPIGLGDRDASGTRFNGDPVEGLASLTTLISTAAKTLDASHFHSLRRFRGSGIKI